MERALHLRSAVFALLLLGAIGAALFISARLATLERPDILALGMTLDMTVALPAAFYFWVARPRSWSAVSVVPVLVFGIVLTHLILPAEHHGTVGVIELLVAPVEICMVALVVTRMRRVLRAARDSEHLDPLAQMHATARTLTSSRIAAAAIASELAVLHFGLFAWRARVHVPRTAVPLTMHKRSNHGPIVVALLMLSLGEGLAAHLLLGLWSPLAAWTMTALGLYSALWIIADYRATVLRPALIDGEVLHLRAGLRWSAYIERSGIETMLTKKPDGQGSTLAFTLFTEPTHWLVLHAEKRFPGPYGLRKRARVIGITPDDRRALELFVEGSSPFA